MAETTTEKSARDSKLIQYLSEMFGNERRLETALEAHLGMATQQKYKERLRSHLAETKKHAKDIERRIKQLGGEADTTPSMPSALTDFAGTLLSGAQKASALAQGPLHALRGTGEEEKQLKNAKTEYAEEAQEIGAYSAIEALAKAVGDTQTVQLVRSILRDERRMFSFLEKEIVRMTNAVVRAEIPASQRNGGARKASKRKATSSRSRTSAGGAKRTSAKAASTNARSARGSAASKRSSSASSSSRRSGGTKAKASSAKAGSSSGSRRSGGGTKGASKRTSARASSGSAGKAK
jgi:ferritin-like metal-binding protein YciE